MKWQIPHDMGEYLQKTALCDFDSEMVRATAEELTKNVKDVKEAATKIFYYVRDEIKFGSALIDSKASDTLAKKVGYCMSKANLQVAILRASGIPARYHRANIRNEFFKDLVLNSIYKNLPDPNWTHCWCECNLSGKWISCESTIDSELYIVAIREGIFTKEQIATIEWDGENDLVVLSHWLNGDLGVTNDLDTVLKRGQELMPPKAISRFFLSLSNILVTNRVRAESH